MPIMMMDLPEELLASIFGYVADLRSLFEMRRVNKVCMRVATPVAFLRLPCGIHLDDLRCQQDLTDDFVPTPEILYHVQSFTIDRSFRLQGDRRQIGNRCVSIIPRLSDNQIQACLSKYKPSNEQDVLNELLFNQLVRLPSLKELNMLYYPPCLSPSILPVHLTHLKLAMNRMPAPMDCVVSLLDHLPQLVSLDIEGCDYDINEIDGHKLVDWVQSTMEQKDRQHPQMKELKLEFETLDCEMLSHHRAALLAFLFFTLPRLDCLKLFINYYDDEEHPRQLVPTPCVRLSPAIVARSGCPKRLEIIEEIIPDCHVSYSDMTHDKPLYDYMVPSLHVEHLYLGVLPLKPLHPWRHCFPHDGIKELTLHDTGETWYSGLQYDGCSSISVRELVQLLLLMPRLQAIHLNCLTLQPANEEDVASLSRLPVKNWDLKDCILDTMTLEQLAILSPSMTNLKLCKTRCGNGESYEPQVIDNPWMPKMRSMLRGRVLAWLSIPVVNLSLAIVMEFYMDYQVLFLVLQENANSALLAFLGMSYKTYALTRGETQWMLAQMDRIHGVNGHDIGAGPSTPPPADVSAKIGHCLAHHYIVVISCLSLNEDKFSIQNFTC
ncbi:hypothetical protein BC940DRAFT_297725 [Gongronella butleri]|nr:hypothetical protein BC940DRAFT_297725 [Gongronella butleri]